MILRLATVRDAEALAAVYAPIVESTIISFEMLAPDVDEMRRRIGTQPANKPWIVAESGGVIAGYAYASGFRGRAGYRFSAEVTVYVAEHARRNGVARKLYRALLQLLVAQGYRRAFAGIALPNDASVALHCSAGFTAAGIARAAGNKFGAWHDVAFYERGLAPLDSPANDPIDVDQLPVDVVRMALTAEA